MKECTQCKEIKDFTEFYKDKRSKDGLYSACKTCHNGDSKQRTKYNEEYYRTKDGLVTRVYSNQKTGSKRRGHSVPTYTKQELKDWLFSQKKFHKLYDNWKESGHKKILAPSCDRKDNNKGYSLNNICLMTWQENRQNGYDDMRAGKLIHKYNPQKPVIQYDLEGNKIAEYHAIREAGRQTNINHWSIGNCCRGSQLTAGWFNWSFKDPQPLI